MLQTGLEPWLPTTPGFGEQHPCMVGGRTPPSPPCTQAGPRDRVPLGKGDQGGRGAGIQPWCVVVHHPDVPMGLGRGGRTPLGAGCCSW